MTRLDEAQERLARALTKLEKASRERGPSGGASAAETEALRGEVAEARARYDRLQGEARAVSDRLDATIERVRGLLAD